MIIPKNASDLVGTLIDGWEQSNALAGLSDRDRDRVLSTLRAQHQIFTEAAATAKEIATSKELTDVGRTAARQRLAKSTYAKLQKHDERIAAQRDELARTEAKAIAAASGSSTPAAERDEEYARVKLAALTPVLRDRAYVEAIRTGNRIIVNAVERAIAADIPAPYAEEPAFISEDGLVRAREMKIAVSPQRAEIEQVRLEQRLYTHIIDTTRTELGELGVREGEEASPVAVGPAPFTFQ